METVALVLLKSFTGLLFTTILTKARLIGSVKAIAHIRTAVDSTVMRITAIIKRSSVKRSMKVLCEQCTAAGHA